ncbi:glycosyltransferase family 2 protein [Candidatus Omnitrophota bacterium]
MREKKNLVSIILTNYNRKKYLFDCLNSLLQQTYSDIEIIYSDDASSDGSPDFVRANFPETKITVNKKNSGLSVTSNNGARLARGEYLFFFNNDTIAFPDLVANLVRVIEDKPDAAVASPVQLPYDSRLDEEWAKSRAQGFSACGTDIYGNPCPALSEEKMFYPDAAIFIKRKVFEEIGGFDPDLFLFGNDIDICWRVHLLGYKIICADRARFRHDSHSSQIEDGKVLTSIRRRALVECSVISMILKYYRIKTLLFILPTFSVLFAVEALFFLLFKFNHRLFIQVYIYAVVWNMKNLSRTLKKRSAIQKIRKVDDREIMKKMYFGYAKLDGVKRMGIPVIR